VGGISPPKEEPPKLIPTRLATPESDDDPVS